MIGLIILVAILGVVVWLVLQVPMPAIFRNIIIAIVVIGMLLYLASFLGAPIGRFPR